ncbi:MAG: glycosyltransferase family 4 protein [Acidobacteria bacterium]|nr:glycosyltransferase family 4 protein [Acidobacteriota bacterium]
MLNAWQREVGAYRITPWQMSNDKQERPLKILLVAPTLPIVGGQTVQAERLFLRLKEETVIEVSIQSINPRFLPSFQRVKYLRTAVTSLKYWFDLLRRVPRHDVIHIFSASYSSFVISPTPALLAAKLFGKPTILNYRSGEADDHLTRWKKTAIPTIKAFDRIIVPSGYLIEVFKNHGLEACSIFNFIDILRFPFRKRDPLKPVFLSNRNFEPHYNVSCVLRAFAILQNAYSEARLIVVGDGSQREELYRIANDLDLRNVDFRGAIPPSEISSIYREADIYLNTPSIDNMPSSILEAFSAGLPVVSTNAGGIPYIVENERTGLLVDIDDHEALAAAALRLLNDNAFAQGLIENAHEEVKRYSWEKVRDQWLSVYRELANK